MANKYDLLKERVQTLEETIAKQSSLMTDMVLMFTILLEKEVLTLKELEDEKDKHFNTNNNQNQSSPEGCSIQSEEARSDESGG